MEIKAVKFRRNGYYTQPFAFGGEEGPDKFDHNIRYRGSLQNYLIDTGSEVILVDTGLPALQAAKGKVQQSIRKEQYPADGSCSFFYLRNYSTCKVDEVIRVIMHYR